VINGSNFLNRNDSFNPDINLSLGLVPTL